MNNVKLLKQGAEGKIFVGEYNGKQCLIKERFEKKYRHAGLDKHLTKGRIKAEQKAIQRCEAANVLTPKIYNVDLNERKIYMEYLDKAITVKTYLNDILPKSKEPKYKEKFDGLAYEIGSAIGKMHTNNIVHGDLTTSNMLLDPDNEEDSFGSFKLVIIDFGLSSYSGNAEDKGVDLYVLERALLSTHSTLPELFSTILNAYKQKFTDTKSCDLVIAKFEDVRARGRKRTMVG